jgi:hypothetical protein
MKTVANIAVTILMIVGFTSIVSAENVIDLTWSTKSETNNDYFTIERSIDGINWEPIATENAAGSTSTLHSYSYTDETAPAGIIYYNLKQTDKNGLTIDLKSISIDNKEESTSASVILFPNPTTSYITLKTDEKIISASITSSDNKMVKTLGTNVTMTNVQDLESGVYYIVYTTEAGSTKALPFVKR